VQLLQVDRGAHRGSLQLGLIHHHPHIGVESGEVARPAPARAAVAAHQLAAHHLIQGAHDHRLGRQGIGVVVVDLAAPEHMNRDGNPQPCHHRPALDCDLLGEGAQGQLIHQPPGCGLRPLLPVP
jgi:hypothetical protein